MFKTLFLAIAFTIFTNANEIISYQTSPKNIQFFQKDSTKQYYLNLVNFKKSLEKKDKELIFATNGGMYLKDFSAQGLYIENGKTISPINKKESDYGNFYIHPNGIFYIDNNYTANIVPRYSFKLTKSIKYATQSGPMLVINGKINSKFNKNSTSYYIRNGVCVLQNGKLLFAISKEPINFYNFANFFKAKGCKNALYLDGYVSQFFTKKSGFINPFHFISIIIAEVKNKKQ